MEQDLLKTFFTTVLTMGPGGLVAAYSTYLYFLERKERQELQADNRKMLEDTVESRHALASVLEKIATKVGA